MAYAIDIPFQAAGRQFVVSSSTHKISARPDALFICGFCSRTIDGSQRYHELAVHTDPRVVSDDYIEATYMFCDGCVSEALRDFPDLPNPAVARAIAARIQRDQPPPSHYDARSTTQTEEYEVTIRYDRPGRMLGSVREFPDHVEVLFADDAPHGAAQMERLLPEHARRLGLSRLPPGLPPTREDPNNYPGVALIGLITVTYPRL